MREGEGGILNKMTKNYMEITKSTFIDIGQNGRGYMGGQANFLRSKGMSPIPPHKGTLGECMHVDVCVLERRGWGVGEG